MLTSVAKFTFNSFQENTFVIHDGDVCVIIDPGCNSSAEEQQLIDFIEENRLEPTAILLTHGHLDHVMGVPFLRKKYGVPFYIHEADVITLKSAPIAAQLYGIPNFKATEEAPTHFLNHGDLLEFGQIRLEVMFTPGHAPGHVVFYNQEDNYVINGDVLFNGSFGRYDLPGGDLATLIASIKNVLFELPDDTLVCCGHGPETTIGAERKHNPILDY